MVFNKISKDWKRRWNQSLEITKTVKISITFPKITGFRCSWGMTASIWRVMASRSSVHQPGESPDEALARGNCLHPIVWWPNLAYWPVNIVNRPMFDAAKLLPGFGYAVHARGVFFWELGQCTQNDMISKSNTFDGTWYVYHTLPICISRYRQL